MKKPILVGMWAGICFGGLATGSGIANALEIRQEMEMGIQDVRKNNPEAKFEEYKDVPQGLLLNHIALDVDGESGQLSISGKDVGQETQSYEMGLGWGRLLDLKLGWDQSVHRWSENARTLYTETSPGVYEIPDTISDFFQASTGTAVWWSNIDGFLATAHDQELAIRRDKASAEARTSVGPLYSSVAFSMEKKFGNQLTPLALGRSYLTELARSVDETVYDSGMTFGFAGRRATVELGYNLNVFDNGKDSVTWDSTKRSVDQFVTGSTHDSPGTASSRGRAAMQPDNLAQTFRLHTGFDLTRHSRLKADVAYTRMEQNESLFPYSINSSMTITGTSLRADDSANLPSVKTEGIVNLWTQNYGWANQFDRFSYGASVRTESSSNRSKEIEFRGHTLLDQGWNTTPEETVHFSYRKKVYGGYADWRLFNPVRLGVDYSKDYIHRVHREYDKSTEATWTGRVDIVPTRWAQVHGRYIHAFRNAQEFEIDHYMSSTSTFAENPGLRRFDISSRVRNAGDLRLSAQKGAGVLSLNANLGHDKFKAGEDNLSIPTSPVSTTNQNKMYGLLESRVAGWGTDVAWDLVGGADLSVYYQGGLTQSVQRQNQNTGATVSQNAADDYTLTSRERYDALGLGLGLAPIQRVGIRLGYDVSRSRGSNELSELGSAVSTKLSLPETISSKQDYSIKADYQATSAVSVGAGYIFEVYHVKDFAQDNVPLAAGKSESQTNIMLGDSSLDYKANVISLMARLKW